MRIVFFGSPDFAVCSLDALLQAGFNVVGVVSATDKQANRGHKVCTTAVKDYALAHNLPLLQPENMKSQEFLSQLKEWRADLQIVVAFRMMPKAVYAMPELGTFNLHGSLLPRYRGAAPINWAIINGETKTGVSTFLLNDKIDEGEIIYQESIDITPEDNFGSLHDKLMLLGATLVVKTAKAIESGKFTTIAQSNLGQEACPAPKIFSQTTQIDWGKSGEQIVNLVRGLVPAPCAKAVFLNQNTAEELNLKVFSAKFVSFSHKKKCGTLIADLKEGIRVFCPDGFIQIIDLQQSGKREMSANDFLRGLRIKENWQAK
jgi:methionyl-tRNA formyltransferase